MSDQHNTAYIENKFKDVPPTETIERIKSILKELGMDLQERVRDAGIGDCYSVHVYVKDGFPLLSNGKGVTVELARASAYAEFIERLQCCLFYYKFQSFNRFKELDLQSFAPDSRYMTMQELEESGDWMDAIIESYGHGLTRKRIAKLCKIYGCADEDKILTVPYYNLFEDKVAYMPTGFMERMYASNGCCAGNSREEAWVHAFSEMMERKCAISAMKSGQGLPKVTDQVLERVPLAKRIYDRVRSTGMYDIEQFDLSNETGYPVIGTRIINKRNQRYIVNAASDPIFEIAVSRGLTEILQGRELTNISSYHDGSILADLRELPVAHNLLNQLETGNGVFPADFFAEELTCDRKAKVFPDNTSKTNRELLQYAMDVFRGIGKPVYVRNYSFLGFDSYHFVIPGFSEYKWMYLFDRLPEYAMGDEVVNTFRNPMAASDADLATMLAYYKKVRSVYSMRSDFTHLSGLPISEGARDLLWATLAYASYRLNDIPGAISYLGYVSSQDSENAAYFNCVSQYLTLTAKGIAADKIKLILGKFHVKEAVEKLYDSLAQGKTPFDDHLPQCVLPNCSQCRHRDICHYERLKDYMAAAGQRYSQFTHGQDKEVFQVD